MTTTSAHALAPSFAPAVLLVLLGGWADVTPR